MSNKGTWDNKGQWEHRLSFFPAGETTVSLTTMCSPENGQVCTIGRLGVRPKKVFQYGLWAADGYGNTTSGRKYV